MKESELTEEERYRINVLAESRARRDMSEDSQKDSWGYDDSFFKPDENCSNPPDEIKLRNCVNCDKSRLIFPEPKIQYPPLFYILQKDAAEKYAGASVDLALNLNSGEIVCNRVDIL